MREKGQKKWQKNRKLQLYWLYYRPANIQKHILNDLKSRTIDQFTQKMHILNLCILRYVE